MKNTQRIKGLIIQNESSSKMIFQMSEVGTNDFLVPMDENNYNDAYSVPGGATQLINLGDYDCGTKTWLLHLLYFGPNPWLNGNEQYMYDKNSHLYARYKIENYSQGARCLYLGIETEYTKPKEDDKYYPDQMNFVEDDSDPDFDRANCGFIVGTNLTDVIMNSADGAVAWDMPSYSFLSGDSPKSVHKNLWRMEKLNNINGIFQVWPKVNDKNATQDNIKSGEIFQARSYDLSTMSIIKVEGHKWALIDPLLGPDTAVAAWTAFKQNVDSQAQICAIMITHSHVDHYKGVDGLIAHEGLNKIAPEDLPGCSKQTNGQISSITVPNGYVVVLAPIGFYDESISENLYLGNCMGRRAQYMYGGALPRGIFAAVGSGLGKTVSNQVGDIPVPSLEIPFTDSDVQSITINGKEFVYQNVPGTEAPAEMHIGFKIGDTQILCPGENVCQTMHNLLTPRGAKVRDPKAFGNAIDRAMDVYPKVEVLIGTHHWPTWGETDCRNIMEKQRDMYYYFNNQVIHLLNSGYNMEEIAENFKLPDSLMNEFYNRGYYGTLNHDTKAVVQRYIGWWDGNPANYFKYPEEEVAKRFVCDMGGEDNVLSKAHEYYKKGDYRWTVELTRNVVFVNPANDEARKLEADALEQLAYSFEGGTWRNIFLAGAYELRGIPQGRPMNHDDIIASIGKNMESLTPECVFEYLSILIDGNQAAEKVVTTTCTIAKESFSISLKNGVLHSKATTDNKNGVVFGSTAEFANTFVNYMKGNPDPKYQVLNPIFDSVEVQNPQWNIIEPLS